MTILVTGSAGHLGEGLFRTLRSQGHDVVGIDVQDSPFTTVVASIADRSAVKRCMRGVEAVVHTATLHKPHGVTHSRQDFVDTNITGTLNLLEEALAAGASRFVFTSTTSAFGRALSPSAEQPAAWITERVAPLAKNIYGVTKIAAEGLCELFHRHHELPCLVLRTSRFFPEQDDNRKIREGYEDSNAKANEFLNRRVELEDVVTAHLRALDMVAEIGFGTYIISATSPFSQNDLRALRRDAPSVVKRLFPEYEVEYARRGWRMFPSIDRVYVNAKARTELGWSPRFDFKRLLTCLSNDQDPRSELAKAVGSKGYHDVEFEDEPFPV